MNGDHFGKFLFVCLNRNHVLSYALLLDFTGSEHWDPLFFLELNFVIKETISLELK